jgi:RNA polymerase sigma-70 factor, ECF subfamily
VVVLHGWPNFFSMLSGWKREPEYQGMSAMATPPPVQNAREKGLSSNQQMELEAALIARVLAGESEAFYELVRPHERSIYTAAYSILGNEADAEEVAQEAVLKAYTHLARFRAEAKFSTWIVQITLNEARMKLRKDRRKLYESLDDTREDQDGEYIPKDYADWREIPSETLQQNELRQALARALASLSPKYREVFVLRDVQKLSIAETAKMLGITESSVKTRLLRARLQMRDALAPGIDGSWTTGREEYKKVRPW